MSRRRCSPKKDGERWRLGEKGFPLGVELRMGPHRSSRSWSKLLREVDPIRWLLQVGRARRGHGSPAGSSSRFWCRIWPEVLVEDRPRAWFVGAAAVR